MNPCIRASLLALAVSFAVGSAYAADPAPAPMTPTQIDQHLNDPSHTDSSAPPDSASHDMAMPAAPMHHHTHHAKHHHKHHHHHTMKKTMPSSDKAPAAPADESTKGN